ncbi:RraA family protein [Microlunatus speluncae]|uniref:RraA family protein n=1 Tax=Microlunatus speluncae TaxID=2594267 RepID=UPI00126629A1|nr:RraA family protein [Microlunatus speluncae]
MSESTPPRGDAERLALITERLYTPVLGDVLDTLGRLHQFLPAGIRALRPEMKVAGRAMPVLTRDVFGRGERPFGRLTEALDQLAAGEVYLGVTGRSEAACWGEILTATARMRGAAGAVLDGHHRDTPAVLAQDFPVFSRGSYALDSGPRTAVVDYRVPVELGSVRIEPGDLVVGDVDGVVIIPRDVEDEVLERALQKASAENLVRREIEAGMSATDAFAKYGVL